MNNKKKYSDKLIYFTDLKRLCSIR